ncbi:hypothetical protein GH714_021643 [Hevea brasiliensis]|uniref:Uncharacterized protein n=1 Tax=Hevea brasiliensis TaxID=3981 RepID=A0A6A6KTQ7_HEVBR|nr:hypothetical protein GH714_021643 [Hevea brasiliensis]
MDRVLDTDGDGGCFDRTVAAIKLLEESVLTAFVQQVRAEAMSKHDDRLAAYVPKKSRGHGQRVNKKPHSQSSLFHHVKSSGSVNENKNKKRVGGKRCFESVNSNEDQQKKRKLLKRPRPDIINFANFGPETPPDMLDEWWDKIRTKGGTDVKLVIMKQMFATDLNPHHDRFSIPFKQIRDSSFLTEDEKSKLKEQKENIPITLMEPCGDESKMLLRRRNGELWLALFKVGDASTTPSDSGSKGRMGMV